MGIGGDRVVGEGRGVLELEGRWVDGRVGGGVVSAWYVFVLCLGQSDGGTDMV